MCGDDGSVVDFFSVFGAGSALVRTVDWERLFNRCRLRIVVMHPMSRSSSRRRLFCCCSICVLVDGVPGESSIGVLFDLMMCCLLDESEPVVLGH